MRDTQRRLERLEARPVRPDTDADAVRRLLVGAGVEDVPHAHSGELTRDWVKRLPDDALAQIVAWGGVEV